LIKIIALFFPFFIFSQNVEMYLALIYEGKIEGVESKINEMILKHPNDPGVLFLEAITTSDG